MPPAPAQIVATIPSGPLVINVPPAESLLQDLGAAHGRRVLEGDRAEVLYGIRIVDIRANGALPWVMTVDAWPGSITVTIG